MSDKPIDDETLRPMVQKVLDQYPELSEYGIRRNRQWSDEDLHLARQALLDQHGLDEIRRAAGWVSELQHTTRKTPRTVNSYRLKHYAEPTAGYFTNGAMIVAAVLTRVEMRFDETPNPVLLVIPPDITPSP